MLAISQSAHEQLHVGGNAHTRLVFNGDAGDDLFRPDFAIPPLAGNAGQPLIDAKLAGDGLYGIPFQTSEQVGGAAETPVAHYVDLTKWKVRVNIDHWGQASNNNNWEHHFDFGFPVNSRLQLVFGGDGRAVTENISPGALPDTDEFHVFQLFDKTAIDYDAPGDVPPAGAPNEETFEQST